MISVAEAKSKLLANIPAPVPQRMLLSMATGYVLAEDVYSPIDMPPFPQSAMDGYALHYKSWEKDKPMRVSHIIQAGASEIPALKSGEACRIFTGAPVPEGADTVVMQEKVQVLGDSIQLLTEELTQGANVRPVASQTAKGTLAAPAGTHLGPGVLGFLASLGIADVMAFAVPRTSILITGKELVPPGGPLRMGQVYESNSITLRAALAEGGIVPAKISMVDDDADMTYTAIKEAVGHSDLVLITGGVSVGDYDFVHAALQRAGVETVFYKIRQKPGKPLYCGRKTNTLVFGLPGNPASVLSCFYQYVVPAIRKMKGMETAVDRMVYKTLSTAYTKKSGLTHFLKATWDGDHVKILQAQESYKMNAYIESNCMVELDEAKSGYEIGDRVKVYPYQQLWHT